MKRIFLMILLVLALAVCGAAAESVHTPGEWGYHPPCPVCGTEMTTWGTCTSCFEWCSCFTGYCSASMVPASECPDHGGNCPLLAIAGADDEESQTSAPETTQEQPNVYVYPGRQDILNTMRVFMLDELYHVTGCEVIEKEGLEYYALTFEDGVVDHGSEGDSKDWYYGGGILSDFDVDLDGDGVNEYVTVSWSEAYDEYDMPKVYITVYEAVENGYVLSAKVPVPGTRYSEIEVWLIPGANKWNIMADGISRGDGGSCFTRNIIYDYDGKNFTVLKAIGIDNYNGGVIVGENGFCQETYDYITNNYVNPVEMIGYEFSTHNIGYRGAGYDPVPDGFSRLSEELAPYGVVTEYDTYDVDFTGTRRVFHFCGRHDDNAEGADLAYGVLSSQVHTSGKLPVSETPEEEQPYEGIGKVIDEEDSDDEEDYEEEEYEEADEESEYYIADSDERLLTRDELSAYSKEELGFIRNEILARYGYPFKKEKYREYFESTSWYVRDEGFQYSWLNEIEMKNVELIKSME